MRHSQKSGQTMDMLSGSLFDKLLLFAIPLALSSILQQLFNSVDVAVVGHFAADPAVATAAVGSNGPIMSSSRTISEKVIREKSKVPFTHQWPSPFSAVSSSL